MADFLIDNVYARYAVMLLIFIGVAILAFVGFVNVAGRRTVRDRLTTTGAGYDGDVRVTAERLRRDQTESGWLKLVTSIEKAGVPLVDTKDEKLRARMIAAGFRAPYAARVYTLVRLVMVFAIPLLVLTVMWASGSQPSIVKLYLIGVGAAAFGLYLPFLFISAKADRRQQAIINGFPDAIDLMLVCVEAGLGLEAAMNRVGMEIAPSHPLLSELFGTVVLEMRAGRSQEDALRRMSDRAGSDEIKAFTTLLVQSSKLGSSIAQTLRIYAAEMREKRRMRAEEKAHRLPVLISIPLVGCMLPVMIGVLMLPAVIQVVRVMIPAMSGGAR